MGNLSTHRGLEWDLEALDGDSPVSLKDVNAV